MATRWPTWAHWTLEPAFCVKQSLLNEEAVRLKGASLSHVAQSPSSEWPSTLSNDPVFAAKSSASKRSRSRFIGVSLTGGVGGEENSEIPETFTLMESNLVRTKAVKGCLARYLQRSKIGERRDGDGGNCSETQRHVSPAGGGCRLIGCSMLVSTITLRRRTSHERLV